MPDKPICFVISPIGKEGSDIRQRADLILKHVIAPIAAECGFEAVRADKISEPGMITTQVINHVINDAMVVADLTGENANVFYELAIRHAAHMPYVQIIEKGQKIPFDLAGVRTIEIDLKDLDSVEAAKAEMKKQMLADASKVESPISVAIDFDKLRRSDDPAKRELADILQGITEIKALVDQVRIGMISNTAADTRFDGLRTLSELGHGLLRPLPAAAALVSRRTPQATSAVAELASLVATLESLEQMRQQALPQDHVHLDEQIAELKKEI